MLRLQKRHDYHRAIKALLDGVWRADTNGSHSHSKAPCRQGSSSWSNLPSRHGHNEPQRMAHGYLMWQAPVLYQAMTRSLFDFISITGCCAQTFAMRLELSRQARYLKP